MKTLLLLSALLVSQTSFAREIDYVDYSLNLPAVKALKTAFPVCGASKVHPCVELGTLTTAGGAANPVFVSGVADYLMPLTTYRAVPPAGPFGPYEHFKIGVAPIDTDGVKLDPATYDVDTVNVPPATIANNHALVGSTRARWGRLNIDNAYGSERLNLSMRVSAQYWNGNSYSTNTLDSCTPLAAANFTLSDYRRGITATNMPASHVTSGANLASGEGKVVLKKPSTAPIMTGSVMLNSSSVILPGSGRGTFGVYKAGPVIYVRETY